MQPSKHILLVALLLFTLQVALVFALHDNQRQQRPLTGSYTSLTEEDEIENENENATLHDNDFFDENASLDTDGYTYCWAGLPGAETYMPLEDAHLLQVQVVTRHGDRSPNHPLPYDTATWNCPLQEYSFLSSDPATSLPNTTLIRANLEVPHDTPFAFRLWRGSCDVGQLTERGVIQMQKLGTALRRIYIEKLGFINDASTIYVRSTDIPRTKYSAQSLLTGLLPFNPIHPHTIHILPGTIENMFGNPNACSRLTTVISQLKHEEPYNHYLRSNRRLRLQLRKLLGTHKAGAQPWWRWDRTFQNEMDVFWARVCHSMDLPCAPEVPGKKRRCATRSQADKLLNNVHFEQAYLRRDGKLAQEHNRLAVGSFLGQIANGLVKRVFDSEEEKKVEPIFKVFSGHDDTIHGILGILKARDMRWAPYASSIVFELWKADHATATGRKNEPSGRFDDYFLRVIYNGRVLDAAVCDFARCPLEVFLNVIEKAAPDSLERECVEIDKTWKMGSADD